MFRSFSDLVLKFGKKSDYARGLKVENIISQLKSKNKHIKRTLSGCIIQKLENSVIISRENG